MHPSQLQGGMMTLASILLVDADANARSRIAYGLRELGHDVSETSDAGSDSIVLKYGYNPTCFILCGTS